MKAMRITTRIILFPFILIIYTIYAAVGLVKSLYNFARYGGEIVPYQKGNDKKTVQDTYLKLKEFLDAQAQNKPTTPSEP